MILRLSVMPCLRGLTNPLITLVLSFGGICLLFIFQEVGHVLARS